MSFINTLLPRSVLLADTHRKLSSSLAGFQSDWQIFVDKVAQSYDIDKLDVDGLLKLVESFSLLETYNALTPYYRGSLVNEAGESYAPNIAPLDKVGFLRRFLRGMLSLRGNVGTLRIFDVVMGILGVPDDAFVVLQDFIFFDASEDEDINDGTVLPRRLFSKLKTITVTTEVEAVAPNKLVRTFGSWEESGITASNPEHKVNVSGFVGAVNNVRGVQVATVITTVNLDDTLVLDTGVIINEGPRAYVRVDGIEDVISNLSFVYSDAPLAAELFPSEQVGFEGDHFTPTQTLSLDILTTQAGALGDEFVRSLRVILEFLKPTHVIMKDISAAVYLTTDDFFNINMSRRGQYTVPNTFRFMLTADAEAEASTNRLLATSFSFVQEGFRAGGLVTVEGFTNGANNVLSARIIDIADGFIELHLDDATLVNEGPLGVTLTGDVDHSFEDGLVTAEGFAVTGTFSVTASVMKINRAAGSFLVDGFKVGHVITAEGFTDARNNVNFQDRAVITAVTALQIETDFEGAVTEGAVAGVTLRQYDQSGFFADHDLTMARPFIEQQTDTMHPVGHQPGPLPTLASRGSYELMQASARQGQLDATRYNNLNPAIGGRIYLGFCVQGDFNVEATYKVKRGSGSWVTDGFVVGAYISTTGFTNGANNVSFKRVLSVTALELEVDNVTFITEDPVVDVQVCVDMLPAGSSTGQVSVPEFWQDEYTAGDEDIEDEYTVGDENIEDEF